MKWQRRKPLLLAGEFDEVMSIEQRTDLSTEHMCNSHFVVIHH